MKLSKDPLDIVQHFECLTEAVNLTHRWRRRVYEKTDVLPPTVYHRILLYLWMRRYTGDKSPISMRDVAEACGLRPNTIDTVIRRMENDGYIKVWKPMPDSPADVTITELGKEIAET